MADYCKQCNEYLFGQDYGDLAADDFEKGPEPAVPFQALCEGCGPIEVDYDGKRIDHLNWKKPV